MRSSERPKDHPLKVVLDVAREGGGNEVFSTELQAWWMLVPDGMIRVAVSLCIMAYAQSGLILEGVR